MYLNYFGHKQTQETVSNNPRIGPPETKQSDMAKPSIPVPAPPGTATPTSSPPNLPTRPQTTTSTAPPKPTRQRTSTSTSRAPTRSAPEKQTTKPLPFIPKPEAKRPGTSGTELDLRTLKRDASSAYITAQRAEKEYRTRRQARVAREEGRAAKVHLARAWREGGKGVKALCKAIRFMPSFLSEKMGRMRKKGSDKKSEKSEKGEGVVMSGGA
ncbi:hypothetical protein GLAREA_03240 [Glarea lozoyensis ATCC 20868]|uniref:Uncharacterized protein n=1 Tax=Glarea lozoyensis (strain ATCC 20868 / MF5171) TaxID=1116229 RepID=S3CNP3_GLAL2|nr:uncharacterized protein GLAREA_03240 [Glarea lozoyensis ATCC 20868]EPE27325.1 hypothetical protein GLAREA_03240 [Glarea lozoyensis ATCC 20868]